MSPAHVLILPSWYPTPVAPTRGIFFQQQALALSRADLSVGVAYPELRSLRTLRDGLWLRNRWQTTVTEEKGLRTVRHHGWNPPVGRLRKWCFVGQAQRVVRRYIEQFGRPDLIHAHAVKWGGVAAEAVADDLGLPFVLTEHSTAFPRGAVEPWEEECFRQAFHSADRVLAVSRALADSLARYTDRARVEVVPNVVDTEFFTLPPAPRSSPPFTFVVVAALRRKKGLDVLLKAFRAAFGESSEDVRLRIGGGGPLADKLEDLSRSLGLEDRVAFLGRLSRQEVRREMWEANVAVLPSRVETFGVVVIEAMSTGLPVLATRCGGPEEIITEDTGWLVDPEDPKALAEGLRTALEGASQLSSSAPKIRRHVRRRYSESAVANRLRNVYRAVVGSERAPS